MAAIEKLGALLFSSAQQRRADSSAGTSTQKVVSAAPGAGPVKGEVYSGAASPAQDTGSQPSHVHGVSVSRQPAGQRQPMSLNELAEVLRRVNLTFDLFEVQAKFSVDSQTGEIKVEIVNQRTGEVIRRIPPYDLPGLAEAIQQGQSILADVSA